MIPSQAPAENKSTPPGVRKIQVGAVLIVMAVVLGIAGVYFFGSQVDLGGLERDVVISGAAQPKVPGRLAFRVLPAVAGGDSAMKVGIAVDYDHLPTPECELKSDSGRPIDLIRPIQGTRLMRTGDTSLSVLGAATLDAGDYEVSCDWPDGADADGSEATFTVGRVLDVGDLSGVFKPLLLLLVVVGSAGLVFVGGLIVMSIGLIQRTRASKGTGPYQSPPSLDPPGPYPPGSYPPNSHPPGVYPPGPYPPDTRPADFPPPTGGYPPEASQHGPDSEPQLPSRPPAPPGEPSAGSPAGSREHPPESHSGWTIPPSKR